MLTHFHGAMIVVPFDTFQSKKLLKVPCVLRALCTNTKHSTSPLSNTTNVWSRMESCRINRNTTKKESAWIVIYVRFSPFSTHRNHRDCLAKNVESRNCHSAPKIALHSADDSLALHPSLIKRCLNNQEHRSVSNGDIASSGYLISSRATKIGGPPQLLLSLVRNFLNIFTMTLRMFEFST